ncbi:MAG: hypothetical protein U0941_03060 [Planctomycetaceae bacterium]
MPGLFQPSIEPPVLLLQQRKFVLSFPEAFFHLQRSFFVAEISKLQLVIQSMNPEFRVFAIISRRRQNEAASAVVQVTLQFRRGQIGNIVVGRTLRDSVCSKILGNEELA